MIKEDRRVAIVRVGKNNNILFSEVIRSRKDAITRHQLEVAVWGVLKQNQNIKPFYLSKKIISAIMELGGVNEKFF